MQGLRYQEDIRIRSRLNYLVTDLHHCWTRPIGKACVVVVKQTWRLI